MGNIFYKILYQPVFNALIFLYEHISFHDFGIAIILITILIRFVLFPLFFKSAKDQAIIQRLSPRLKEIQEKHKANKEEQARAMMELYKEHKVNPFSSLILIILQFPIMLTLYQVFQSGLLKDALKNLYPFMAHPGTISYTFLGSIDLSKPSIIIVVLAAIAQYFQGRLALPPATKNKISSPMDKMGRQMVFMGPVLTLFFFYFLPSAVGLYWLTTSVFSVIQQIIINKSLAKDGRFANIS